MTRISICLQGFISNYPTGVILEDIDDSQLIDSSDASTVEEYVEFAKRNADKIGEDTEINIVASMEDIGSTAVIEFANEVAKAIKGVIDDNAM